MTAWLVKDNMKTFKNFLCEESDIVKSFIKDKTSHGAKTGVKNYGKRDNCGPACHDLMHHAIEKHNVKLHLVKGYFHADHAVHEKADFTKDMKNEFKKTGKDFNNKEHRKEFIENHPVYSKENKKIPHYWTKDDAGNIHDPSGHAQFVKKGLSKDLDKSRYHEED